MIINIPRSEEKVARRFRSIERLINGVTYRELIKSDGTSIISFDEVIPNSLVCITSGRVSVDQLLMHMTTKDLKAMLENCLNDIGGFLKADISSISSLIDSYSWSRVEKPENTTWSAIQHSVEQSSL